MQQEHQECSGCMSMVAVLSKDIVPSEAISDAGSSDSPVDGFVVVTRKKQHEVGMATSPLNPKQSNITGPL